MSANQSKVRSYILLVLIGLFIGMVTMSFISSGQTEKLIQMQSDIVRQTLHISSLSEYLAHANHYRNGDVSKEYMLTQTTNRIELLTDSIGAEHLVKELDNGNQVLEAADVEEYYQYIESTIRPIAIDFLRQEEAQLKESVNMSSVNISILSIIVVGVILQGLILFEFKFKRRKKQTENLM